MVPCHREVKDAIEHEEVVLMDDLWTVDGVDGEDLRKLPYEAIYDPRLNIAEWACRRHARVCPLIWYDVDGGAAQMSTAG